MTIQITEVGPEVLSGYNRIPISFQVESVLQVEAVEGGLGGLRLREEKVAEPYLRDYDAEEDQDATRWAKRFDISNWGFLVASEHGETVGEAALVFRTPEVHMLDGRTDLTCLWDLRVHPGHRGKGAGHALFRHAVGWARERECRQLKIETTNTNVRACRFYARQGCHLGAIVQHIYREPAPTDEVMLLWYLDL